VPGKDRQRALARAKLERQMAQRAAAARRRRQIQASLGAILAVALVVAGTWYLVDRFGPKDDPRKRDNQAATAQPTTAACLYSKAPKPPKGTPKGSRDVGVAPINGIVREGVQTVTMVLDKGTVTFDMDLSKAPCTANSFGFLAMKKYFDGTQCHRLVTKGIHVLQCGDPTGSGTGGPGYQFGTENLPVGKKPAYPAGTVAMARSQDPGSNGSQFFIVYKDTELQPDYTIFGKVTSGLDVVQKIAAGGVASPEGDGPPKQKPTIKSVRVSEPKPATAG